MCLILFAYQVHPVYPLIVAANRDEFYARPTAPAHVWEDHPEILAGRDLEKMGTWMGVTKAGRFAALTNYRDPKELSAGKRSRGEIVTEGLTYSGDIEAFMQTLAGKGTHYPGYNLLAGDIHQLFYFSNVEGKVRPVTPGVHGVSNHLLDTEWPKVQKGKAGLAEIVKQEKIEVEELFSLLQHAEPAKDEHLPNTGVPLELERMLSPLFIKSENYGTRSSTVLFMSDSEIQYVERTYTLDGVKEKRFTYGDGSSLPQIGRLRTVPILICERIVNPIAISINMDYIKSVESK